MRIGDKELLPPTTTGGIAAKETAATKAAGTPDPFTDPHRTAKVTDAAPPPGSVAARQALLGLPDPVDGAQFCAAAIADMRARALCGERCVVVFDIDNTLVDTRYRTLAIARAWGEANGVEPLAHATIAEVGIDGRETCQRLGLGEGSATDRFQAHWLDAFWSPASFNHDQPIAATVELARAAHAAGAEVYYLTGRIESLRTTSREQLARCGLPVDDEHLVLKPELGAHTASYKNRWLEDLFDSAHLGFFVTEGRRDVHHIQNRRPDLPCVLFGFPLDHHDTPVRADTPLLAFSTAR